MMINTICDYYWGTKQQMRNRGLSRDFWDFSSNSSIVAPHAAPKNIYELILVSPNVDELLSVLKCFT